VVFRPLNEQVFLIVVGNERNGVRGHAPLSHTAMTGLM
jgi:hypothetical protein